MALSIGNAFPGFPDDVRWLHGNAVSLDAVGGPLLIHFWAVSCPFCKANFPILETWREKHSLVTQIAVHTPRIASDQEEAVISVIGTHGMSAPCVLDDTSETATAFQIRGMLPHYFLFDENLKLRSRAAGKSGLTLVEMALHRLMAASEREAAR